MAKKKMKVRDIVTEKILAMLSEGVVPWRRPWRLIGRNRNLISKRPYRGINVWLLAGSEYSSPWWVTYRQAKKLGGNVRRGEKGTKIVFWKWLERKVKAEEGEPDDGNGYTVRSFPMMRYYTIFNVEQTEGLDAKIPPEEETEPVDPIEAGEALIERMPRKPVIKFGGDRAYYSPLSDVVGLPERDDFETSEGYYASAFHELAHSTGHEARLGRFDSRDVMGSIFGSTTYSKEELVAEMSAAFLMAEAGIEQPERLENSAAYIKGWLKALNDDHSLVVVAAQAAQKAADFILDTKVEELKEAA
jgi:antirestriction protein ArdC